jgi:hypothetical protein
MANARRFGTAARSASRTDWSPFAGNRARPFYLQVPGRGFSLVADDLVVHLLAFTERGKPGLLDRRDVHEHVLAAPLVAG